MIPGPQVTIKNKQTKQQQHKKKNNKIPKLGRTPLETEKIIYVVGENTSTSHGGISYEIYWKYNLLREIVHLQIRKDLKAQQIGWVAPRADSRWRERDAQHWWTMREVKSELSIPTVTGANNAEWQVSAGEDVGSLQTLCAARRNPKGTAITETQVRQPYQMPCDHTMASLTCSPAGSLVRREAA